MSNRSDTQPDAQAPVEDALEQSLAEEEYPDDAVGLDGTPVDQLMEERRERLTAENRDENTSVDNTQRDFDVEKGMFTDDPDYDTAEKKFPPLGEGGA